MRPLRYSINVTLDGCCDHRVVIADEAQKSAEAYGVKAVMMTALKPARTDAVLGAPR